ncbi:MAG: stage II sporulation protein M, partial [Planctomycetota bacterium]
LDARRRVEFAALYRAACADLSLADTYHLPADTVRYLNQLVGRAHNQLYRTHKLETGGWADTLFRKVPQQLFHDRAVRLASLLFWGPFLASMFLASNYSPVPDFAEELIGEDGILDMENMHSQELGSGDVQGGIGSGFYIHHNASIGIRCFVWGLVFGIGGMFETLFNAVYLGAVFGHMTTVANPRYFFEFVTAHGPFELTAIVLCAAAGMKMGFSLVSTGGLRRLDALAKTARESMPILFTGVLLFIAAAFIEGFLSPSAAPYEAKAFVAMLSTLLLLGYMVVLGYSQQEGDAGVLATRGAAAAKPAERASPFDDPPTPTPTPTPTSAPRAPQPGGATP